MIQRMMYTRYEAPPSQAVPVGTSWVVPYGVHSVSVVTVGCELRRGSAVLVGSINSVDGDGGGLGGNPGAGTPYSGGAGGHGGYTGNGGNGGRSASGMGDGTDGENGFPGSGGGGGGGGGAGQSNPYGPYPSGVSGGGGQAGGVGLNGTGPNGGGGGRGQGGDGWYSNGANGTPGSALAGATVVPGNSYDGASGGYATRGSHLAWRNNIPVTPGETLNIVKGPAHQQAGIRLMWGGGRSYPANAGNI